MTTPQTRRAALEKLNRVDEICDRFEDGWRRGARPRIEAFLNGAVDDPASGPAASNSAGNGSAGTSTGDAGGDTAGAIAGTLLAELIRIEVDFRSLGGELVDLADYRRRFPDFADVVNRLEAELIRQETVQHGRQAKARLLHYDLLEEIGTGAFGTVWRAWDTKLEREVAIKIPRGSLGDTRRIRTFLREAQAAAKLRHPNVVPVHEFGELTGSVYIAFGYVAGVNLKEWLEAAPPTPQEAATLCAKIADGLAHAHSLNVVHRDLKPGNVILDGDREPHITDFGMAKRDTSHSTVIEAGLVMGTPAYMSPEQARGHSDQADARSDIYSLGVILYEMLTGKVPFRHKKTVVQLALIQQEPPRPPRRVNPKVPRDLETVCLKALAKDPAERYQTAAEMAADLRRFLDDRPVLARRIPPPVRAWRWVRRNRLTTALSTVAVSAVAVAVAAMAFAPPPPPDGRRDVRLLTEPEGAKLTVVPLDVVTHELRPDQLFELDGVTPLDTRLHPGDYLIVAVLDNGRFHEVYRHVPEVGETHGPSYRHRRWKTLDDGTVEVAVIQIPLATVTDDMTRVEGSGRFRVGGPGGANKPAHTCRVPTFYVDPVEVSVEAWRKGFGGRMPIDLRTPKREPDEPICVKYDEAVMFAEKNGKRLLTEIESEYTATWKGTQDFPWGNTLPANLEQPKSFGPVGTPAFDRIPGDIRIFGLCSNVAEWVQGDWHVYPEHHDFYAANLGITDSYQVVRGGNLSVVEGNPQVTPALRNPRERLLVPRYDVHPGLGFRCARSARPRTRPEDYVGLTN